METIVLEFVKEFGSLGVILWLVWWTQCRVIPGLNRDCRNERKEQRDSHVASMAQITEALGRLTSEFEEHRRAVRSKGEKTDG